MSTALPDGVRVVPIETHRDDRGFVGELIRAGATPGLLQWTVTRSRPGVLRGVHVHLKRWDHYVVLEGHSRTGVFDARVGSPTEGRGAILELPADRPGRLLIPPGVLHSFYHEVPSVVLYGMSEEYDPTEELGCRWDDPELGLDWNVHDPILSDRDTAAGSLSELRAELRPFQPL